jgi:hypothetical protein
MKSVSGKRVAIAIAAVIFIAVAAGCYWMYMNYLAAPRQP